MVANLLAAAMDDCGVLCLFLLWVCTEEGKNQKGGIFDCLIAGVKLRDKQKKIEEQQEQEQEQQREMRERNERVVLFRLNKKS